MRANDFLTEREVNTTNKQGVQTTVDKAANRVTTRSDMGTVVKDRSGGVRSIQTPNISGVKVKQTFRPDSTPGYGQANYKSGGMEFDLKGSPETGYDQTVKTSVGGLNMQAKQRYSGQKEFGASATLGNNQKVNYTSTVSKPGAKPVNQMSMTKGGKTTTVTNDINEKPLDDITLQRALKFGNEIDADKERNPGAFSMTSQATKDFIAKARAQDKSQRVTNVPSRAHDKDGVHKQGFKPVTFDPKNSMSNVKIAMDDINEAFEQAIFEDEVTLEDTQDFHEEYGYLGYSIDENDLFEAEYRGRKVKLNKPMRGDVKKFKVYVKNKKGNVIKVNFGHGGTSAKRKTMRIRKSNPKARKSFRARHNCDNPGPKTKARYWSCRKW